MIHNVQEIHCVRLLLRVTVPMVSMTMAMRYDCQTTVTVPLIPLAKQRAFCGDGQDNDNDGLTDWQDPDCATNPQCQGQNLEQICDDGQDNDNDGNADCGDSDCANDPACNLASSETSCTNSFDDDGDGDIDCFDSDCQRLSQRQNAEPRLYGWL